MLLIYGAIITQNSFFLGDCNKKVLTDIFLLKMLKLGKIWSIFRSRMKEYAKLTTSSGYYLIQHSQRSRLDFGRKYPNYYNPCVFQSSILEFYSFHARIWHPQISFLVGHSCHISPLLCIPLTPSSTSNHAPPPSPHRCLRPRVPLLSLFFL